MNRMDELYKVTLELDQLLSESVTSKNRDKVIEDVQQLLSQRESLIQKLGEPYTEQERAIGKELLPIEQQIQQKLQQLFTNLKTEIRSVKKQKVSNQKYVDPYKSLANYDGAFWDKKK